jgi:hypothetical protein
VLDRVCRVAGECVTTPDFSLGCMYTCLGDTQARGMLILSAASRRPSHARAMACGLSKGWWIRWGCQMQARQGIAGMLEGPVCDSAESFFMQEHVSVLAVKLWRILYEKKAEM